MKKVDWSRWASIAEILSAIAIVVTLIYLAAQTQHLADQTEQNNRILRAQAADNVLTNRLAVRDLVISDSEFAAFYVKVRNEEPLSETEKFQVRMLVQKYLLNWQLGYRLFTDGSLALGEFSESGIRGTFCGRASLPHFGDEWSSFRESLWPEFVLWMEQNVVSQCD